jgi:hypothetical protein
MSQRYRPRFWVWLFAGAVLHFTGVAGVLLSVKRAPAPPVRPPSDIESPEVTLLLEEVPPPAPKAAQAEGATPPPLASLAARKGVGPRAAGHEAHGHPAAGALGAEAGLPRDGGARAGDVREGDVGEGEARDGDASPDTEAQSPRALSLEALGVGGVNPFLRDYERVKISPAERLASSLRSAIASQDQKLGLGPEGPATRAVIDIVQQSTTTPDSSATLRVRTDATGAVQGTAVMASSGDSREWERIAAALVQALHGRTLRIPHGANGMTFDLKITSREQLPSGASPGLAVKVFGQTLKHGRGDRPTTLRLFEPEVRIASTPIDNDPLGRNVDSLIIQFTVIGFNGDPTDIGAPARRVVHARLTDLTVY